MSNSTLQNDQTVAPFGSWDSPISAQMLVSGAVGISEVIPQAESVWWAESRPDEAGRVALMRHANGHSEEVLPDAFNVRTTVHEYGGGAWWVKSEVLWFIHYDDQRIHEKLPGESVRVLSPRPPRKGALRYTEMRPSGDGHWVISVCERHGLRKADDKGADTEPENLLIATARDGSGRQIDLATGADFYGSICLSQDGKQIAWVEWDHPNMPWDTTRLMCADLHGSDKEIRLSNIRTVAGGHEESVIQPLFSADGRLHFLSDRNDHWHVYALDQTEPVLAVDGEIGYPPWVHGIARYGFDEQGQIVAARFRDGIDTLPGHDHATSFSSVRLHGSKLAFACASWQEEVSVWYDGKPVRAPRNLGIDPAYFPAPEVISFTTGTTEQPDQAHALFFRPANPGFTGMPGEKPPLIVLAHGGPTSSARSQLSLAQRFWTSRGFAVVDVNYRGSSGYGRQYRKKLNDQWGIADVQDCVAVARFLAARGDVDGQRLIVRGGSAGGFTVLSALAMHDVFTAGACLYGVADLEALADDTHKFESRYLDSLIGPWPEQAQRYKDRSPINHLDGFSSPMIVLQGSEDAIVPPNQSRMIVQALDKKGIAVAYIEFAGEQHGFRKAETIITASLSELAFYGRVFGFQPAGESIDLEIKNEATLHAAQSG